MERSVVVVAPTFNEQECIGRFVKKVLGVKGLDLQVVISDSQSKDRTCQEVKKIRSKRVHLLVSSVPGPGKLGVGLFEGIDYAVKKLRADVIVTMEADLTENPEQISQFVVQLESCDLVIGSRYAPGGKIVNWSWWRKFLSRLANFLLRVITGAFYLREYTNLYRGFTREAWGKLRPRLKNQAGWLFVPGFVFEALGLGLRITEIPITYFDRLGGRSKMRTVSYSRQLLSYAWRYRSVRMNKEING